mgnify:CR=1 FL=1
MARTKADFRALRETVGFSQHALAAELGVRPLSVKRWERPDIEGYNPPDDAWQLLDAYLMTHDQMVAETFAEVEKQVKALGRKPDCIPVTYYRDQGMFNEFGRDEGCYGIANANARALAGMLRRAGYHVEFRYPGGGAVTTPGSRY